jgi:hypothetical protein
MNKSTVLTNKAMVSKAIADAEERVRSVLRPASAMLLRLGGDTTENREIARKAMGLPSNAEDSAIVLGQVGVYASSSGSCMRMVGRTPADFDLAMADARRLARLVEEGVERYMAAHDAETAVTVSQFDASAK